MSKVDPNFQQPEKKPRARRKRAATLEFDFAEESLAAPVPAPSAPPTSSRTRPAPDKAAEPLPSRKTEMPHNRSPFSSTSVQSTPIKETPSMTPSKPSPVNVRSSIERQSREQRAVGTMLNGVAIAFICSVVLVASLASLGGYVLFKQIRNQSATITLLESNTRDRIDNLQAELAQKDADLLASQREGTLRLTNLQGEFESYRNKTSQSIAQLVSANAKLEQRLTAVRQDFARQDALLSEYRRNR